jgi:hypothetical protein
MAGFSQSQPQPKPWTPAEDAELARLDREEVPTAQIAVLLRRSDNSVRARLRRQLRDYETAKLSPEDDDRWERLEDTEVALRRTAVYEAAVGCTEAQVIAEVAGTHTPEEARAALRELTEVWRKGRPLLRLAESGRYERLDDRDMQRSMDDKAYWAPRARKERNAVST